MPADFIAEGSPGKPSIAYRTTELYNRPLQNSSAEKQGQVTPLLLQNSYEDEDLNDVPNRLYTLISGEHWPWRRAIRFQNLTGEDMSKKLLWIAIGLLTCGAAGAELPAVPAEPIAKKKELLFSDDFERAELGKKWAIVVPTYAIENGALKGTQVRVTAPATDGKPAVVGHAAVIGSDVPTKDSIIELRFRFAGATALSAEFDDRAYKGSHYGHICRVVVTPKDVTLRDERDGSMRNDIYEMSRDPAKKEERNKLLKGHSATFPLQVETDKWHTLVLETVGDTMRATIDDKPVAFLKSSGIAHPTKSKIELGCAGKEGYFDDVKIWDAEAVKP
jgi:hypothetical protein